ncbi:TRAP transporter small permease [Psychrobacillus soli]|uniref:TRAP transporter small permease n=1 Tax=Psychrobacillus soli TaxID=1543965 RepID=A0A544TLE2_9BACI|nr:TRAP transporter small permease [Psychrobacillus soli]TQR18259.1 TRAP transporter small permease [Psychrobacillus soli]
MGKIIERILGLLTVLSFAGVIITVTIQIMSRYLPYTAIWTEELTRYFFLYAICFGAPLALLRNEFINVDLILNRMSNAFRRYYEIVIYIAILLLCAVMIYEGYRFTLIGHSQTSATMPFQMSFIHAAILIMSMFLAVYSVVKIVHLIRNEQDYSQDFGGEDS